MMQRLSGIDLTQPYAALAQQLSARPNPVYAVFLPMNNTLRAEPVAVIENIPVIRLSSGQS